MGAEDHGACGRRAIGLGCCVGGGVFRQGIRRDLSRAAAQRGSGNRRGSRPLLAFGNVHPRRALLAGRNPAGTGDRRAFADHDRDPRWPHADPGQRALAFDRADCGEPQFIQRIAGDGIHHDIRLARPSILFIASPLMRCGGGRPGAAAFPIRHPRPNIRAEASLSLSAAFSVRSCSTPAIMSRCRPPEISGRRGSESNCTI